MGIRGQEQGSRSVLGAIAIWFLASLTATAFFSLAVASWLSEPLCSGVLWPNDINSKIVRLLGGLTKTSIAGKTQIELPWLSVFSRMLSGLSLCCVVVGMAARVAQRAVGNDLATYLRKLSIILSASFLWWGLWFLAGMGSITAGELSLGLLPIWFMATVGVVFWLTGNVLCSALLITGSAETGPSRTTMAGGPLWILALATIAWVSVSFWLNKVLYDQLMIPHGDSAMYEEHLWNLWHGKGFRSYLDQGLFLGEHIQVIHLLLLPLHWLWPSHLLLELSESVALGSCSLIIFSITLRRTGSHRAAMWMGLAWLCFFPMHFLDIAIDQKTFRPIVLGLPFLFGMIHYGEQGQLGKTLVCLVLALSAKEDMALVACPILAVLGIQHRFQRNESQFYDRRWKSMLGLSFATAGYLVVTVLVIIPAFRSGEHVHYARYFGSLGNTPGELIRTAVQDPLVVLAQAFRAQTLVYLAVLLVPLAFLPVRRLLVLSSGVITFSMLSLLQFSTDATDLPPVPYHHFHAPLLPVLFWAAICALGSLNVNTKLIGTDEAHNSSWRLTSDEWSSLAFSCCLATAFTGSLTPMGATFWSEDSSFGWHQLYFPSDPQRQLRAESIDSVIAQLPSGLRIASTDYVHTRLTHFERSYDYSDYLRAVNNYRPGVPGDTDVIILDLMHPYSRIRSTADVPELGALEESWALREDLSNSCFLVLVRTNVNDLMIE